MSKTDIILVTALLIGASFGSIGARATPPKEQPGPGVRGTPKAKTRRSPAPRPVSAPSLGDTYRPFTDLPPDHWAAAAVETLHRRGVVVGYPTGTR